MAHSRVVTLPQYPHGHITVPVTIVVVILVVVTHGAGHAHGCQPMQQPTGLIQTIKIGNGKLIVAVCKVDYWQVQLNLPIWMVLF